MALEIKDRNHHPIHCALKRAKRCHLEGEVQRRLTQININVKRGILQSEKSAVYSERRAWGTFKLLWDTQGFAPLCHY